MGTGPGLASTIWGVSEPLQATDPTLNSLGVGVPASGVTGQIDAANVEIRDTFVVSGNLEIAPVNARGDKGVRLAAVNGHQNFDVFPDYYRTSPLVFADLPAAAAGYTGAIACVSDSVSAAWGATVVGGGANTVLTFCDGAAWTVFAK